MNKIEERFSYILDKEPSSNEIIDCFFFTEEMCIKFGDWLNKNASRNNAGTWQYFNNMFYVKTTEDLFKEFLKTL